VAIDLERAVKARVDRPELELRPLGIVLRPQLERRRVVAGRRRGRSEELSTVAGFSEGHPAALGDLCRVLTARLRVFECLQVVVGEELRVLVTTSFRKRLDPAGRRLVLAGAARPRNLPVGDVADE